MTHYPSIDAQFPAAFAKSGSDIRLLIPHTEINKAKSMGDLIHLVTKKVKELKKIRILNQELSQKSSRMSGDVLFAVLIKLI